MILVYVNRCEKCCVRVLVLILLSTNPNNQFAWQDLLKIKIKKLKKNVKILYQVYCFNVVARDIRAD